MAIIIKNVHSSENGSDGVRISINSNSDIDITLDNINTFNNGGMGLNFTRKITLQEHLSLDSSVKTEEIKQVIEEIRLKSHTTKPEIIVEASGLHKRITDATLNLSTFVSNIVSLASNPSIQGMFTNT